MRFPFKVLPIAIGISMGNILLSCSQDYDLSKNIDTEINVGNNLSIPVGQTERILLNRIIKPGDQLKVNENTGLYELISNRTINSNINPIEKVTLESFEPIIHDEIIPLQYAPQTSFQLEYSINNISNYNVNTTLPEEVETFQSVEVEDGNGKELATSINVSVASMPAGVKDIEIQDCELQFPSIIKIKGQNSSIVKISSLKLKDGKASYPIVITGIDINGNEDKYIKTIGGKKKFILEDVFALKGKIIANTNPSQITTNKMALHFVFDVPVTKISKISGTVNPKVNINEIISINDIPDFIKDENNKFTPSDIRLGFEITNPVGMAINANLSIAGYDNDKSSPATGPVSILLSNIRPESTTKYIISNAPVSTAAGEINVVVPELTTLLSSIPDYFKIQSTKVTASSKTLSNGITLGVPYSLNGNYDINIPFAFDNFELHYTDRINGLLDDLKDVSDKINKALIKVDGTGVSTIPANLTVGVKLLDSNGNELKELDVELNKVNISASEDGATPKESPIQITITQPDGSTQLERLESIEYTINGLNDKKGTMLKSSQYIQIKDIKVNIPNGINTKL